MSRFPDGEFGLIGRLREMIGPMPGGVIIGPGDDAALFRPDPGKDILISADAMAEGIHFDCSCMPLASLGWKSLAANISDIAAMGGRPRYAVVSLGISPAWTAADTEALVAGMKRCGDAFTCTIIGGDISAVTGGAFISITVTGDV